MQLTDTIYHTIASLPESSRREVLHYALFLLSRPQPPPAPPQDLLALLGDETTADLDLPIPRFNDSPDLPKMEGLFQ